MTLRPLAVLLFVAICWSTTSEVSCDSSRHHVVARSAVLHPDTIHVDQAAHALHKGKHPKKHEVHTSTGGHKEAAHLQNGHAAADKTKHGKHAAAEHHQFETAKKGHQGTEHKVKKTEDATGKHGVYHDSGKFALKHHNADGHKHTDQHAEGKKAKKTNYLKGYRQQYHKDEHKKQDSFYSSHDKKGEFHRFGTGSIKQHAHHHDKSANGKHKEGKFADKHGKEGKTHKEHSVKAHKSMEGGHSSESHHGKNTKWAKKNGHNHQQ